ncbi:hypothetical protein [Streptomyces sp. NRRL F-5630]|uniref:hypothetical protein n=1 Tax=Streptomyces sp. NRRL F-5630 TaxID=1463864 RepID=UPI003EB6CB92
MSAPTPEPLTPDVALVRLRQYGERTSTWSTATYNDGTEQVLADIARTLGAEVTRLREQVRDLAKTVEYFAQQSSRRRDRIAQLDAELAARPSRAEALRGAAEVLDALPADATSFDRAEHKYRGGAAAETLRRMADEAEAGEQR